MSNTVDRLGRGGWVIAKHPRRSAISISAIERMYISLVPGETEVYWLRATLIGRGAATLHEGTEAECQDLMDRIVAQTGGALNYA